MTKMITSQILKSEKKGSKMVLQGQLQNLALFATIFKAKWPSRSFTQVAPISLLQLIRLDLDLFWFEFEFDLDFI